MILIQNGYVKTMAGADLENGCVLLDDNGKIAAVAAEIAAPEGCTVIDAAGKLVTPGLVEAHCHIGADEKPGWEGLDHNEKIDPITPQMRIIDSFNPQSAAIEEAVRGGVTTACSGPGSANVIGGTFGAFKLAGKRTEDMILKYPVAMKCAFGENPKKNYGQTGKKAPYSRMGVAAVFRDFLFRSRRYYEDVKAGKSPAFDIKLDAMIPVFEKMIPLKAHCHRADDIFTAIRIAKEFDLKLTLDHCTDGGLIADELAKEGYPALVGPSFGNRSKMELAHKGFATAGILHRAGMKFAIITDSPVTPLQYLPMCAGLAVSEGLPMEEGWKAITRYPAEIMGISDRVGTLEIGKDADVVIWNADPLTTVGAKAHTTIINGKVVWEA